MDMRGGMQVRFRVPELASADTYTADLRHTHAHRCTPRSPDFTHPVTQTLLGRGRSSGFPFSFSWGRSLSFSELPLRVCPLDTASPEHLSVCGHTPAKMDVGTELHAC